MSLATVKYRDYIFSITGRPNYGRKARYESETPDTPATRARVTYAVQHEFTEDTFADNQARWQALREALAVTEGVLYIADENGTVLVSQIVRVEDADLPVQWGQHFAQVTISFGATENLGTGSAINALYTPTGGSVISLPNVNAWKESIKAERYSTHVANRRESNGAVLAAGRVKSNPEQTSAQRRAYLQGVETSLKASIDSKDGRLVYGTFDRTVRIDSFDTDIHDGSDYLDWTIGCSYRRFPSGDFAEADFTISARDDLDNLERVTSLKGTVKADDESGARAKAAAIIATYASGKVLRGKEAEAHHVDGTDGTAWIELSFSAEFRESIAAGVESYNLTISDKDDLKAGQLTTTYSGRVVAETASAALIKARDLGDNKYTIRLTASESVVSKAMPGSAAYFVEVTFSYDYLRKGSRAYAEVMSDTSKETFGTNVVTTSGYTVATSESAAVTLARSFKPDTGLLLTDKETSSTLNAGGGGAAQHNRVDFTYVCHEAKPIGFGSVKYKMKVTKDYKSMQASSVLSGTAWADTDSAADTLINALITSKMPGSIISSDDRESEFDKTGLLDVFMSRSFTISVSSGAVDGSGNFGDQGVIEASYSLETTFSVNATVITPIPYGLPHIQTNTGTTPGMKTASGTVTCLTAAQCRSWARDKIPSGGYAEPYREKVDEVYASGSSNSIKCYKIDFNYTKRYQTIDFP